MPVALRLALVALFLPFGYAVMAAPFSDGVVQAAVEIVVGAGVLAAVVGVPVLIVMTVLQTLSPPRRGGW